MTNSLNSFRKRIQELTSLSISNLEIRECAEYRLMFSDLKSKVKSSQWIMLVRDNSILRED